MTDPATPPSGGSAPAPNAAQPQPAQAPAIPASAAASATTAPAAPQSPATPPANPQPAPTPAQVQMTSEQLKARFNEEREAERRALLKDLGFEKPDDLKAALKKLGDLETEKLSEREKLEKRIKELEPLAARTQTVDTMLKGLVEAQFNELPEGVRKAIDATANGDADKRLELMGLFRASGLLNQQPSAPAAPPPPPAPATVTPSPAPPPAGAPTKFQEWELMKAKSPLLGDLFYQQNQREIERTRPAS